MTDQEFLELRNRWKKIYCDNMSDGVAIPSSQVKVIIKLYEEHLSSRESRPLSDAPSEEEIEAWYIENYGVAKDLNGKPSWSSSIGYRTEGDLFEMLNDFVKWIKKRGMSR